jgi:hypothetical protein
LFGLPIASQKVYNKPFDIHKSKLALVEIKFINFGKTYTCFIFSTKLSNILGENDFLEENTTLGDNCTIKHLNHTLSTNYTMVNYFSQSKGQVPTKSFLLHIILIERFLYNNKKKYCTRWNIWPFSLQVNFQ